ncbi:MAG: hypothetical protein MUE44_16335 [Oscillatoriaceae cyanobacterium Prado104]|nr:hypothetical protein [Oscillatoriaceae cyanobacterium Prado104]
MFANGQHSADVAETKCVVGVNHQSHSQYASRRKKEEGRRKKKYFSIEYQLIS